MARDGASSRSKDDDRVSRRERKRSTSPSKKRDRRSPDEKRENRKRSSKRDSRRSRSRTPDRKERSSNRDRRSRERSPIERRRENDDVDIKDVKPVVKKEEDSTKSLEDKLKARKLLEEAQRKIFQTVGKNDTRHLIEPANLKSLKPDEASAYVNLQMSEKERKLQELKNKLKGITIPLPSVIKESEIELTKQESQDPAPTQPDDDEDTVVDSRVQMKRPTRGRRQTFKFVQKGEYEKLATVQRNTARLNMLQSEIETVAKQTGISSAVKLALVTPDIDQTSSKYIPDIEWWDEVLLQDKSYSSMPPKDLPEDQRYAATINNLIQHPTLLKAPDEPREAPILKVFLTKKEMKKRRRQERRERQKEQMEKVRLGLEPPPEPKVKISNLMRVLGNDAIQDPTRAEAYAREQMQNRLKKHLKANAERKLTEEERSDKKKRKIFEDTSLGVHVSIYSVKSLANASKRFKVEQNAKQLTLTGCIIFYKDINVVIVEGGPKQQRFFKNLMMNRLKWHEEIVGQIRVKKNVEEDEDDDTPKEMNQCQIIWEGIVKSQAFNDFKVHMAQTPKQARELLDRHAVGHYWDHAYSASMFLQEENE